ncbi:hypothetical protein LTR08_009065 [Meristemomyces frigidus]|nr:hypothetical protein LTR08_009065 [Meristemomyces frigidus]
MPAARFTRGIKAAFRRQASDEILVLAESTGLNASITPWSVRQTIFGALQGPDGAADFPAITEGLQATLEGNPEFFTAGSTAIPTIASVVAMPIECSDYDLEANTFASFNESLTKGLERDTSHIRISYTWQIQLMCIAWPFPVPAQTTLPVDKKMLLVTADFDPVAPTEYTTFAFAQAKTYALAVRHEDDHVSFGLVHQPSTLLTKEFLRTGVLPTARNETLVTVYTPGMEREPIPDLYDVPTGPAAGDLNT